MENEKLVEQLENAFQIQFGQEEKLLLLNATRYRYKKGSIVLHQGDKADALCYMIQGIVRGVYLDSCGCEHTKCFSREGTFFSTECFITKEEATYDIECIEEVTCIRVPYQTIQSLIDGNAQIAKLYQNLILKDYVDTQKRARALLELDAENKYKSFMQEYAGIAERIKQKYIASYIGVDPVSLSRLRKKLGQEKLNIG